MILVWFRNDLRLNDNPALNAAISEANHRQCGVIACYTATPKQWQQHHLSPYQADLIQRRLYALRDELAAHNISLLFKEVDNFSDATNQLTSWVAQFNIAAVFVNHQYEIHEQQRDNSLIDKISPIPVNAFHDRVLTPPGEIVNKQGEMYKVFSAFKKSWFAQREQWELEPIALTASVAKPADIRSTDDLDFTYEKRDSTAWGEKETHAIKDLNDFCEANASLYHEQRDFPQQRGTSRLSPYLALGCLSPRQCLQALEQHQPNWLNDQQNGAYVWFSEIIWREFYTHIIHAFPRLVKGAGFQPYTDDIVWSEKQSHFEQWCAGATGFPIVDAAMRQLNTTGWMHNRLRMITASFLVKDLQINWRWGERYFMANLIDGDFAANNGGWQWAASTGTDAQPYFRVFNPYTQGQRFDPQASFIKRYVKELQSIDSKIIHKVDKHQPKLSTTCGYVAPMVNHSDARNRALALFKDAKTSFMETQNG